MNLPFFSVILTTYNRSNFLNKAIKSVLQQTFNDFELIIIDDDSTDNTEDQVKTYTDKRINYFKHIKHRGASAARNTGILASKAKYVSFLDDDDEFLPMYLEKIHQYVLQYPNINFIWTGIKRVIERTNQVHNKIWNSKRINKEVVADKKMLFLNQIAASYGLTILKECFKIIGIFNENLVLSEDLDLIFRLVEAGFNYATIPQPLIKINIYNSWSLSRSSNSSKQILATEHLINQYKTLLEEFPHVWLHYHTSLLSHYYRAQRYSEARRLLKKILIYRFYYLSALEVMFRFEFQCLKQQLFRKIIKK